MTTPENRARTGSPKPGTFKPGQSGNPGGRPKVVSHVREAARAFTEEAVATLAAVMTDDEASPAARVSAATALLDRAWGRPTQSVDAELSVSPVLARIAGLTDAELAELDDAEPE